MTLFFGELFPAGGRGRREVLSGGAAPALLLLLAGAAWPPPSLSGAALPSLFCWVVHLPSPPLGSGALPFRPVFFCSIFWDLAPPESGRGRPYDQKEERPSRSTQKVVEESRTTEREEETELNFC